MQRPRGTIGLDELAQMDVIHGSRRGDAGTYGSWLAILRTQNPRFEFTGPPFRRSLRMTLAFAASGSRTAAVLTGPRHRIRTQSGPSQPDHATDTCTAGMVPVRIEQRRLTAVASLVWNGDLPRQLQQVLFETADDIGL